MTPVSIYQKIRDKYSNSVMLESSDYGANDNSYAYVCFNSISSFKVYNDKIEKIYPDNLIEQNILIENSSFVDEIDNFCKKFQTKKI